MKIFVVSVSLLSVVALLTIYLSGKGDEAASGSRGLNPKGVQDRTLRVDERITNDVDLRDRFAQLEGFEAKMKFVLADPHIDSERYRLLVELLNVDEDKVLAFIAKRHYPEDMDVHDPAYREMEMVTRSMVEFYGDKPLGNNLEKIEAIRSTGPLFSRTVVELFFSGKGDESAQVAYDWVIKNSENSASLSSGTRVGAMLVDSDPEAAWDKIVALPEGAIRSGAFSAVLNVSALGDIDKIIDLINSIGETPDLDQSISNLVSQSLEADYDYRELVPIAVAPFDSDYRMSSLSSLFRRWAADDPESLIAWSQEEHDFPADELSEINLIR